MNGRSIHMTIISCSPLQLECKLHKKRTPSALFLHIPATSTVPSKDERLSDWSVSKGRGDLERRCPAASIALSPRQCCLSSLLRSRASWICLSLDQHPPLAVSGCPLVASACAQFEPPHGLGLQQGLRALAPSAGGPSQPFAPGLWPGQ